MKIAIQTGLCHDKKTTKKSVSQDRKPGKISKNLFDLVIFSGSPTYEFGSGTSVPPTKTKTQKIPRP